MMPRPPTSTLFPYTTLFRSLRSRMVTERVDPDAKPPDRAEALRTILKEAAAKLQTNPRDEKLRSEEHTSELQSLAYLVCRLLLEKKNYSLCRFACSYTGADV